MTNNRSISAVIAAAACALSGFAMNMNVWAQTTKDLSMGAQSLVAATYLKPNEVKRACPKGREAVLKLLQDTFHDYQRMHRGELQSSAVSEALRYFMTTGCRAQ